MSGQEIASAYVRIRPNTAGFRGETETQVGSAMAGVAKKAALVIGGLGAAEVGRRLFVGVVGGAATFERRLNILQAVSGATDAELKTLSNTAKDLGKDLTLPGVSASDAGEAMAELAKGGLVVNDILGASKGVLQLAAAAQIGNADAAKISARALNAFKLEGREAVRVADVLANAANVSTGEISDMALALQQSSAVAHQAGLSIEQTATAISVLANAGVVGSDAGTSIKTFIQRLIPTTNEAAREIKKLGVEYADANGALLPLPQILQNYKNALLSLTPVQKQSTLLNIFGTDAIRAANILIDEGAPGFQRMEKLLSRQGAAAKLAGAQMKGLAGAWEGFKSNVETAAIAAGEHALPVLTAGVKSLSGAVDDLQGSASVSEGIDLIRDSAAAVVPPLKAAVSAIAAITDKVGVGQIIAFAAAYKGIGLAVKIASAGQAFYTRALAAAIPGQAAQANAMKTGAAAAASEAGAISANTAALVANTAAARTNAAAQTLVVRGVATSSAATGAAAVGTAALGAATARTGAQAAASASKIGTLTRGIGALALGATGGATGLAIIGVAALAAGIVFLIRRQDDWERSNKRVRDTLSDLDQGIRRSRDLRKETATIEQGLASDKTSVIAAKIQLDRAQAALNASTAPQGSLDRREAVLNVKLAQDAYKASLDAVAASEGRLRTVQVQTIQNDNNRLRNIKTTTEALVEQARLAATPIVAARGQRSSSAANQAAQQEAAYRRVTAALDEQAAALARTDPAAARAAEALAAYARSIHQIPSKKKTELIIAAAAVGKTLKQILESAGFTPEEAARLASPVGAAAGNAFNAAMAAAIGGGVAAPAFTSAVNVLLQGVQEDNRKQAAALRRVAANEKEQAAISTAKASAAAHKRAIEGFNKELRESAAKSRSDIAALNSDLNGLNRDLQDSLSASATAVNESFASARENLLSIGAAFATDIGELLDEPIRRAQAKLAKASNLNDLASLRASVQLPGGKKLSEDPDKAISQLERVRRNSSGRNDASIAAFILKYKTAAVALDQTNAESVKAATERKIADLTAGFNSGQVSLESYRERILKILQQAGGFKKAGKLMGAAWAQSFQDQVSGILSQAVAIKDARAAGITAGGLTSVNIVRPLETLADGQRAIGDIQVRIGKTHTDLQTRIAKASEAQAKILDKIEKRNASDKKAPQPSKVKTPGDASQTAGALSGLGD